MDMLWLVILGSTGNLDAPEREARTLVPTADWKEALRIFAEHVGHDGELYAAIRPDESHLSADEDLALLRAWSREGIPRDWNHPDAWPARIVALPAGKPFQLQAFSGGEPAMHELRYGWWAICLGGVVMDFCRADEAARRLAEITPQATSSFSPERLRAAWVLLLGKDGLIHIGKGAERLSRHTDYGIAFEELKRHIRPTDEVFQFNQKTGHIGLIHPLHARKSFPSPEGTTGGAPPSAPVIRPVQGEIGGRSANTIF